MAEKVFNRMRDLNFETTAFACSRLLILYQRMHKQKMADILNLMKEENVKPTLFTYKLLIDIKGQAYDISGMEETFDRMKSEGVEPDLVVRAIMAKHYAYAMLNKMAYAMLNEKAGVTQSASKGEFPAKYYAYAMLNEKAEAILEEMEGGDLEENRLACRFLLPLYAGLGKADEVGRVWKKVCELSPRIDECVAAVEAWGRVKRIDEAEACFEMMESKWKKKLGSRHYSALLKVYANYGMVEKGNELVRKMTDSGCGWKLSPPTWDAIVKQLLAGGAVEEADALLEELVRQTKMHPTLKSYMGVMNEYAKMGNVDKAEKLFFKMRQAGYGPNLLHYEVLLKAYGNGGRPPYGMRERLKADGVVPNTPMAMTLELRDASIICPNDCVLNV